MELVLIVLALGVVWWVLYKRRPPQPQPKPLPDPRLVLSEELRQKALEARQAGDDIEAQQLQLRAAWLRTRPLMGQDTPPTKFDPLDQHHLSWVDAVQRKFGEVLADTTSPYAACRFKPAGLLPYPKDYIAIALQFVIDLGEGTIRSPHVGALMPDVVASLKEGRKRLDDFLDIGPDELPKDPEENARFGQ